MDPKIISAYKKVGVVMKSFKSGKLPKAFKVIPQTQNWEELLFLTEPHSWSAHSTSEATKIFSSNMSSKLAQRFFNIILLPNVRSNILKFKKLNYQKMKFLDHQSTIHTLAIQKSRYLQIDEEINSIYIDRLQRKQKL